MGAALTLFSVRVSDKPADEDHTYGHGKVENLSSFGEVILMAVSSGWIIWEAIDRTLHHPVELPPLGVAGAGGGYLDRRGLLAVAATEDRG